MKFGMRVKPVVATPVVVVVIVVIVVVVVVVIDLWCYKYMQ